jgi:hypothetical protein
MTDVYGSVGTAVSIIFEKKNITIARYHWKVSLKGITHNSGSIKGLTLETVKKVSNFSLNIQRKFQLVQHCRLKYGTYLEDVVHTEMALVTQTLLFWRRIRPTCNKTDEHGVILHTQVYKIIEGCFVHEIGKRGGLPETYEFPTLCLVFLCPSMERKSLAVSLNKAIF